MNNNTLNFHDGSNQISAPGTGNKIAATGTGDSITTGSGNASIQLTGNGTNNTIAMPLAGDVGHYLTLGMSGANTLVRLSTTSGGTPVTIAVLNGHGAVSLTTFLTHAQLT